MKQTRPTPSNQPQNSIMNIFFWPIWVFILIASLSIYAFFSFKMLQSYSLQGVKPGSTNFNIALIFIIALLAQITVLFFSIKQLKPKNTAKAYLILIGGTVMIGFMAFAGCVSSFPV
jgi:hypothetical protein